MDFLDQCLKQAALYPRWLVIASLVLTAVATLWLVAKVLKWTMYLLLALVAVVLVAGLFVWVLG